MLDTVERFFLKYVRLHLLVIHHFWKVLIIVIFYFHILSKTWKSTTFRILYFLTSSSNITSYRLFFLFGTISSIFFSLIQIYGVIRSWRIRLSKCIIQLETWLHQRWYMQCRKRCAIVVRIGFWFSFFLWWVILINMQHNFISAFIFFYITLVPIPH